MRPRYFRDADAFRRWLAREHARARELWVGFHKRGSGRPSITWPESVDAALCFGWIDGIRKRIDEGRYVIRFTPRRAGSIWSAVNTRRAQALRRLGLMRPAGLAAYARRRSERSGVYSFEQRPRELPARYARVVRARPRAWAFFRAQPPGYRRTVTWWVVSAKKEETRARRLAVLIEHSARGRRIPLLAPDPPARKPAYGRSTSRAAKRAPRSERTRRK